VRHTGDCGRARDAPTNSGRTTKNGGSRLRLPPSDPRRSAQSAAVPPPNAAQARIAGRTLVWFAIAHTQHRGLGRLDLDARSAVARQRRGGRVGVAGWVFPSLFFPNSLGMFSSAPSSGMWLGALLPSASPHFSPDFVARVRRLCQIKGFTQCGGRRRARQHVEDTVQGESLRWCKIRARSRKLVRDAG